MVFTAERLGTDLQLLSFLDGVHGNRDGGCDLVLTRNEGRGSDLQTLSGADNLLQALLLRFLTPVGALAPLGHPDYGSRLHELIGERNTETNRNRAKMYVLQALQSEPRVRDVASISVETSASDRTLVTIKAELAVIDDDTPLNLVFPFFLEGGPLR